MREGAVRRRLHLFCSIWFCFGGCNVTPAQSQGGNWSSGLVSSSQDLGLLERGSCGYGAIGAQRWPYGFGASLAAQNSLQVLSTGWGGCGTCLEVECSAANIHAFSGDTDQELSWSTAQGGSCTEDARVVVQVLDVCSNCTRDFLTLTPAAAARLGLQGREGGNATAVKYRQVQCQPPGNMTVRVDGYKEDNTWLRFQLLDIAGGGVPSSIQVRKTTEDGGDGVWRYMSNQYGAAWQAVDLPPPPLDLLVTGASGRDRIFLRSVLSEPGLGDFATGAQFPPDDSLPAAPPPAPPLPADAVGIGGVIPGSAPSTEEPSANPSASPLPSPTAVSAAPVDGSLFAEGPIVGPGQALEPWPAGGPLVSPPALSPSKEPPFAVPSEAEAASATPGPARPAGPAVAAGPVIPFPSVMAPAPEGSGIPLREVQGPGVPGIPMEVAGPVEASPGPSHAAPALPSVTLSPGFQLLQPNATSAIPLDVATQAGLPLCVPAREGNETVCIPVVDGSSPAGGVSAFNVSAGVAIATEQPLTLVPIRDLAVAGTGPAAGGLGPGPAVAPTLNGALPPPASAPSPTSAGVPLQASTQGPVAQGPIPLEPEPSGPGRTPIMSPPPSLPALQPFAPLQSPISAPSFGLMEALPPLTVEPLPPLGSPQLAAGPIATAAQPPAGALIDSLPIVTAPLAQGVTAVAPSLPETAEPVGRALEEMPASAPGLLGIVSPLGQGVSAVPPTAPETVAPVGMALEEMPASAPGLLGSVPPLGIALEGPTVSVAPGVQPEEGLMDLAPAPARAGSRPDVLEQITSGLLTSAPALGGARALSPLPIASSPMALPAPITLNPRPLAADVVLTAANAVPQGARWEGEYEGVANAPSLLATQVTKALVPARLTEDAVSPVVGSSLLLAPSLGVVPIDASAALFAGTSKVAPAPDATQGLEGAEPSLKRGGGPDSSGRLLRSAGWTPELNGPAAAPAGDSGLVQETSGDRAPQLTAPAEAETLEWPDGALPPEGDPAAMNAGALQQAPSPVGSTQDSASSSSSSVQAASSPSDGLAPRTSATITCQGLDPTSAGCGSPLIPPVPAPCPGDAEQPTGGSVPAGPEDGGASVGADLESPHSTDDPPAGIPLPSPSPQGDSTSPAPIDGSPSFAAEADSISAKDEVESASPTSQPESPSPAAEAASAPSSTPEAESPTAGPDHKPGVADRAEYIASGVLPPIEPLGEGPAQGPSPASVDATAEGPGSMSASPDEVAPAPSDLDIPPRDLTSAARPGATPEPAIVPTEAPSSESPAAMHVPLNQQIESGVLPQIIALPFTDPELLGGVPAPSIGEPTTVEPPCPPPEAPSTVPAVDPPSSLPPDTAPEQQQGEGPPPLSYDVVAQSDGNLPAGAAVMHGAGQPPGDAGDDAVRDMLARPPSNVDRGETSRAMGPVHSGNGVMAEAPSPTPGDPPVTHDAEQDALLQQVATGQLRQLRASISRVSEPEYGQKGSMDLGLPSLEPSRHVTVPHFATTFLSGSARPNSQNAADSLGSSSRKLLVSPPLAPPQAPTKQPPLPPTALPPPTWVHPPPPSAPATHPAPPNPTASSPSPAGLSPPATPSVSPNASTAPAAAPPPAALKHPPPAPHPPDSNLKSAASPPPVPSSPTLAPHVPPSLPPALHGPPPSSPIPTPGVPSEPMVVSFSMGPPFAPPGFPSPPFYPPRVPGIAGPATSPPTPAMASPPPPAGYLLFGASTPGPTPTPTPSSTEPEPSSTEGGANPSTSTPSPNMPSPVEQATPDVTQEPTPSPTGVLVPARTSSEESTPGNDGGTDQGTGSGNAPPSGELSLSQQVEGGNLQDGNVPTTGVPGFDGGSTPATTETPTQPTQPTESGPVEG